MKEPLSEAGQVQLQELKDHCERILQLLKDPHPGLQSWCKALDDRWRKIIRLYIS